MPALSGSITVTRACEFSLVPQVRLCKVTSRLGACRRLRGGRRFGSLVTTRVFVGTYVVKLPTSRLLALVSIRDVDDGHPNGINLRKRKSVVDIYGSHPYLWCDSAKRRMKCFLASHPRGLLLADFPNNFGSVFRASGCPPRGNCC
jgi:hypothetical protein